MGVTTLMGEKFKSNVGGKYFEANDRKDVERSRTAEVMGKYLNRPKIPANLGLEKFNISDFQCCEVHKIQINMTFNVA